MNIELLLEAERRGILPPDKAALLGEARRRGLVPEAGGQTPQAAPAPQPEEKGFGARLWGNIVGDDDPTTQNTGEKIGTFLNKAGEAMTFGLIGDEASAAVESALPGVDYEGRRDHYRQQEALLEETNPGAALMADVGGSVMGALLPGGAIGTLGKGANLGARMLASGAAGAGMGGAYGFMEGEGAQDRLNEALTGLTIGGVVGAGAPFVGAGVKGLADSRAANRAIRGAVRGAPTSQELRAAGNAAYQQIDDAGLAIRPDRVRSAMDDIASALRQEGAGFTGAEKVMPSSRAVMDAAGDVGAGANTVPLRELDVFRRYVGNAAGANPANRADTRAVTGAMTQIDDFVRNLGPNDIDSGDLAAVQTLLPKARDLWARMSRSQLVDDAIEAGSNNYRSGAASGIRAQFQRILNNPKLNRGFSDAETRVMRRVANGTLPEQVLNYMGSGLGMMTQGAVGGLMGGGIPGALAGLATGAGSRKASEAIVRRNAEIARALVASGKVPNLPSTSEAVRQITEALTRRAGAAVPQ